jgi:pyruvate ferredoxin oxidoreductase delta subunit
MTKPQIIKVNMPSCKEEMPLGPSAAAGVLIEGNAGWRIQRPVIDNEKCIKCLRCWLICPEGVIDRESEFLEIDFNYCKGCGLCAYECPKKAITMVREGE